MAGSTRDEERGGGDKGGSKKRPTTQPAHMNNKVRPKGWVNKGPNYMHMPSTIPCTVWAGMEYKEELPPNTDQSINLPQR